MSNFPSIPDKNSYFDYDFLIWTYVDLIPAQSFTEVPVLATSIKLTCTGTYAHLYAKVYF